MRDVSRDNNIREQMYSMLGAADAPTLLASWLADWLILWRIDSWHDYMHAQGCFSIHHNIIMQ